MSIIMTWLPLSIVLFLINANVLAQRGYHYSRPQVPFPSRHTNGLNHQHHAPQHARPHFTYNVPFSVLPTAASHGRQFPPLNRIHTFEATTTELPPSESPEIIPEVPEVPEVVIIPTTEIYSTTFQPIEPVEPIEVVEPIEEVTTEFVVPTTTAEIPFEPTEAVTEAQQRLQEQEQEQEREQEKEQEKEKEKENRPFIGYPHERPLTEQRVPGRQLKPRPFEKYEPPQNVESHSNGHPVEGGKQFPVYEAPQKEYGPPKSENQVLEPLEEFGHDGNSLEGPSGAEGQHNGLGHRNGLGQHNGFGQHNGLGGEHNGLEGPHNREFGHNGVQNHHNGVEGHHPIVGGHNGFNAPHNNGFPYAPSEGRSFPPSPNDIEHVYHHEKGDYSAIPGEPGTDYPIYSTIPETSFRCANQRFPGYYADVETRCQVFHICSNNRTYDFLCPNGTVFHQQYLVCVWWDTFDCTLAMSLYGINEHIYDHSITGQRQHELAESKLAKPQTKYGQPRPEPARVQTQYGLPKPQPAKVETQYGQPKPDFGRIRAPFNQPKLPEPEQAQVLVENKPEGPVEVSAENAINNEVRPEPVEPKEPVKVPEGVQELPAVEGESGATPSSVEPAVEVPAPVVGIMEQPGGIVEGQLNGNGHHNGNGNGQHNGNGRPNGFHNGKAPKGIFHPGHSESLQDFNGYPREEIRGPHLSYDVPNRQREHQVTRDYLPPLRN